MKSPKAGVVPPPWSHTAIPPIASAKIAAAEIRETGERMIHLQVSRE